MRNPFKNFWNLLTKPFRSMRELAVLTNTLTNRVTELENRAAVAEKRALKAEARNKSLEKTLKHERAVHEAKTKKARQKAKAQATEINVLKSDLKTYELNKPEPIQDVVINSEAELVDRAIEALLMYLTEDTSDLCNEAQKVGLNDTNDETFWNNVDAAQTVLSAAKGNYKIKTGVSFSTMRSELTKALATGSDTDVIQTLAQFFEK